MKRLFLLLPTVSTGLVRLLQLLVLLVLPAVGLGSQSSETLIVGFGLIATMAMLTDSGAANYLLATPRELVRRRDYLSALSLHGSLTTVGVAIAFLFLLVPTGGAIDTVDFAILIALAITQVADSTNRAARSPLLAAKSDLAYSLPDLVLFPFKALLLSLAYVLSSPLPLFVLPVPSVIVTVIVVYRVTRSMPRSGEDRERRSVIPSVLEFGITGALSALYTQAPLLIATLVFTLPELATLTLVYRLVQALDVLPGTVSLQMIPRAREQREKLLRVWVSFLGGGAAIAVVAIVCYPVLVSLFSGQLTNFVVFALIALSFAPKSGNYALVAFLMGLGRIRSRLALTAAGCVLAVGLSLTLSASRSLEGVAAVPLVVESLFAVAALAALRRTKPADSGTGG